MNDVLVPFDARGWSALDRRFREGFLAGVGASVNGAWRAVGHAGVVLEASSWRGPAARARGTPT